MEQIIELLKKHDRFYDYSEDFRVYTKGKSEENQILKLLVNQGMTMREAYNFMSKFYEEN